VPALAHVPVQLLTQYDGGNRDARRWRTLEAKVDAAIPPRGRLPPLAHVPSPP